MIYKQNNKLQSLGECTYSHIVQMYGSVSFENSVFKIDVDYLLFIFEI